MLKFTQIINEVKMTSTGSEGQRHAKQYLTNPETATYKTVSKVEHIPAGETVKVHSHYYDDKTNTTYASISHSSDPSKKITVPISKLHKPMERASGHGRREAENVAIADLHKKIQAHNAKKPLMMTDRFGKIHHIVGAEQVSGNPKANIALVNNKGEHVIHISHKKSEISHQGYGAFNSKENESHPVIKDFSNKLSADVDTLKGKSRTYTLNHNDKKHSDIIKRALFGRAHSDSKSSTENVDEIHHGLMNLKRNSDGTHSLTSEKKVDRSSYQNQNFELVAKNAPDRNIPGTKIKGILGLWAKGSRKGRDVKSISEEFILKVVNA